MNARQLLGLGYLKRDELGFVGMHRNSKGTYAEGGERLGSPPPLPDNVCGARCLHEGC